MTQYLDLVDLAGLNRQPFDAERRRLFAVTVALDRRRWEHVERRLRWQSAGVRPRALWVLTLGRAGIAANDWFATN